MKIAILDDYLDQVSKLDCYQTLRGLDVTIFRDSLNDPQLLIDRLKEFEIVVLTRERTILDRSMLENLPNLKLISQTGKVSNHLDVAACTELNIAIAEGVGSPIAPAELTWALLMNAVRQIPASIQSMQQGQWQASIGRTINGQTIGIWGYGKIGRLVAKYAQAFGARVLVWGSENSRKNAENDGFDAAPSRAAFFSTADVISLHLRLNESTGHLVTAADLALMKPTSVLINTARAELIEPGALVDGLKNGRPAFAAVDVYEEEPIYDSHYELLKLPNVICTPHLGYVEKNSFELYYSVAFRNVVDYLNGTPKNILFTQMVKEQLEDKVK